MLFRNPNLLWLLLLIPVLALLWRWRGVRLPFAALLLRGLSVGALVLALADPILGGAPPPDGPLVVLADQSDSLTPAGRAALQAEAERLAAEAGPRTPLIYFGADLVAAPVAEAAAPNVDPSGSDLAAALRSALALLPAGGRVLVLSDGLATLGDATAETRRAVAQGVTIDVLPAPLTAQAEVAIVSVGVPPTLRSGEEYPIDIVVRYRPADQGGGAVAARLRLFEGEQVLGDQEVLLSPGDDTFTFRHRAGEPGIVQLRAQLDLPGGDTFGANNQGAATALIAPPPRVLVVEGREGEALPLVAALQQAGVEAERVLAERLPPQLSALEPYDGMVLVDVPATSLSVDQMAGVREFVRSEGRGLVAIGGRSSFTLGAYKDTPLEEVLPVQMDPPPRPQRTDIALLLIVDRSASMTAAIGVSKFDMAKEAAILATESLQPNDRIGILAFDTGQLWVVPFQPIGEALSLAQIQEQIAALPSGGGTDIDLALRSGLPALIEQPSSVRHAVLLTDGRSFTNNFAGYQQLVETARAQDVSLSTIAIGVDSDTVLLDQLARWGGGRYYYADQPEDIPRLTLLESEIARADLSVEEPVRAVLSQPHPMVRDFAPAELPQIDGYVAVTPRDGAEVILRAPAEDPLLAAWQYGLGRAVAWTPSAGPPWASQWLNWADYDRFWAQVVRYTLPAPDSGPLQVRLEQQTGGARLTVDVLRPGGEPLDLATVNARVTLPDGTLRSFDVRQSAPGRYTQDLVLSDSGPYVVSIVLVRDGQIQQREVGYVQPVAAEYVLSEQPRDAGVTLLRNLAEATGGAVLEPLAQIDPAIDAEAPAPEATDLWPWLLGLALFLWVLEIALRRGAFIR
ncbi:MAG: VWA domain-containing protein [Oscillochloris sp.]|nr:VWA domain-containing protein [Oscillochloris sp.]